VTGVGEDDGEGVGVAVGAGVGVGDGVAVGVGVGVGDGAAAGMFTAKGTWMPFTTSLPGLAGGAPLKLNPIETDPPAGMTAFQEAGVIL
jgi:hypothetical protein